MDCGGLPLPDKFYFACPQVPHHLGKQASPSLGPPGELPGKLAPWNLCPLPSWLMSPLSLHLSPSFFTPLQVLVAFISFLETMLLVYLSYKVRGAGVRRRPSVGGHGARRKSQIAAAVLPHLLWIGVRHLGLEL